jgi:hypothetical protein
LTKAAKPADGSLQTIKPYYDMSKFFPFFGITNDQKIFQIHGLLSNLIFKKNITTAQNIFHIVAYQTLFVKP